MAVTMLKDSMLHRTNRRGFTLIELLIVIGIISLLVVVLAVAVLPFIGRSEENRTRALLQTIQANIGAQRVAMDESAFRRDAGDLAGQIHSDDKIRSSQMLLFYFAPTREIWDGSNLYSGRNYDPAIAPETFAEFTEREQRRMPWIVDSWGTTLWYRWDATAQVAYVMSAGPDREWESPDDLILDVNSGQIRTRAEMTR
jgi:prepilin-type N-terminal cleavage/methylation domain-containing protein